jgi:hypothetical protein
MHQLPIIRDVNGDLSGCPTSGRCPSGGQTKELHLFCRTLPAPVRNNQSQDVLQDEDGFAILDDLTGGFIFDNLR